MDNEKIINRINNLLAKTVENGCTPEEAAAAAAMAQKLIAKHHINMRDAGEETEDIGACIESFSKTWQGSLAGVITENTCCKVIISADGKKLIFMGKDTDLQAALALYDTFLEAIKAGIRAEKAKAKAQDLSTARIETSYAYGFIQAVKEEMDKQCRALQLVTPEDVEKKFAEQFPTARRVQSRKVKINRGIFDRGHAAGQDAAGRKAISC